MALDLATKTGWALALDQCSEHESHCLIQKCGTINFGSHQVNRWLNLEKEITKLIIDNSPEAIIVESNFVFKNPKTTALLNQLRGAILLIASLRGVAVHFIDNNESKKHLLGTTKYWTGEKYTSVTKDQMQDAVKNNLCEHCIQPQDFDSADAIALALTFYQQAINIIPLPKRS